MTWVVNSTTLDIGADRDTGWMPETVMTEQHAMGASVSIIQTGGLKSSKRTCSGITKSEATKTAMAACVGTVVSITDHHSATDSVYVQDIQWEEILDVSNLGKTFRWTMKLIKQ